MTEEDKTAARLSGKNAVIKFKDGEELFLTLEFSDNDDNYFFINIENFINGKYENFPHNGLAVDRDSIKYVMRL